jgi:tetratricopeptide (TPR) repeat protein
MAKGQLLDIMDKTEIKRHVGAPGRAMLFFLSLLFLSSCSLPRIVFLDDTLSPEEHLNLGVAYEKKGEYDPAISEYKKASKKIPRAYVYMGNTYFEKGDLKKAEESYRKAIGKDASLSDAYNNLAWLYYTKKENFQEAESLASKAVELSPANETYRDTLNKIRELK